MPRVRNGLSGLCVQPAITRARVARDAHRCLRHPSPSTVPAVRNRFFYRDERGNHARSALRGEVACRMTQARCLPTYRFAPNARFERRKIEVVCEPYIPGETVRALTCCFVELADQGRIRSFIPGKTVRETARPLHPAPFPAPTVRDPAFYRDERGNRARSASPPVRPAVRHSAVPQLAATRAPAAIRRPAHILYVTIFLAFTPRLCGFRGTLASL